MLEEVTDRVQQSQWKYGMIATTKRGTGGTGGQGVMMMIVAHFERNRATNPPLRQL